MAEGKWIPGLRADMPVAEAGAAVLTARLDVLQRYLPLAARRPEANIEYVHQLRVAARRTGAALRVFRDCLPEKRGRHWRRLVRYVRRAAGAARDWDVFMAMLVEWSTRRPARERPGLDFLLGHALAQRAAAQPLLMEAETSFTLASAMVDEVKSLKDAGDTFGEFAVDRMDEELAEFDAELKAPARGYEALHRVRIRGKRLRYSMEIFADCFAQPFRSEWYSQIESLQEILGAANDSYVASQRLSETGASLRKYQPSAEAGLRVGIDALLRHHRTVLTQMRRKYLAWRRRWQKAQRDLRDLALAEQPVGEQGGLP